MDLFAHIPHLADLAILVERISLGLIFWIHGRMKWQWWETQPSEQMPASILHILQGLSIAEPLGAIAIALGLLTRFAALGLCLVMLGAIPVLQKQGHSFKARGTQAGWEYEFLLLVVSFSVLLVGPGSYSLDRLIFGF